jgi:uncharacterized DUF497 family protein
VNYRLAGASFEWDAAKAAASQLKHGIPFELVCEVFFDPFFRIVDADPGDEARYAAIGNTRSQQLLFVVHLARHEEITRIISARRAATPERRLYEEF